MAVIRDLAGKIVDVTKLGRDDRVAECLEELAKRNDAGRTKAILCVCITPEGWYEASWAWHGELGLTGIGALEALKGEILATMRDSDPDLGEGA